MPEGSLLATSFVSAIDDAAALLSNLYRSGTVSNPLDAKDFQTHGLRPSGDDLSCPQTRGDVSAREIAGFYNLPIPTITKVLKTLHQGGLVQSHRGVAGGYSFDTDPETVTLGQMLELLEGPWDLVECETTDDNGHALCSIRSGCPSRRFMFGINLAIKGAFEQITLGDLTRGSVPMPLIDKSALPTGTSRTQ